MILPGEKHICYFKFFTIFLLLIIFVGCSNNSNTQEKEETLYFPEIALEELFVDVQLAGIFPDQKMFVDCIPNTSPESILENYRNEKTKPDFDLEKFILANFRVPEKKKIKTTTQTDSIELHLNSLWDHLTRFPDTNVSNSSLIPLPYPYIVPGGRFREIFYWDSYFTMLGLLESGRSDLVKNMLDNFAYLIDEVGYIPNGNRTYFMGRSQPPYFASMIMQYAEISGMNKVTDYLPCLEKEYAFWMDGIEELKETGQAYKHVVKLDSNVFLNRYWDKNNGPRTEAYAREYPLSKGLTKEEGLEFHKHMRSACESGWDFSSRWFSDGKTLATINAADIIPVDQNCLMYNLEQTIALLAKVNGEMQKATKYTELANKRKEAILQYFWNDELGFFVDYNYKHSKQNKALTLAACSPLYFGLATEQQAQKVATIIEKKFLSAGGVVSTLVETGEQWDYPNGWAPLQWITIKGLENYKYSELAGTIASRWMALNEKVFKDEGKMMEKYNVVNINLKGGGGKYPNQDGFGWTNGVYLKLLAEGYKSE